MKKLVTCKCGSGKYVDDCCAPKVRMTMYEFANPEEQQKYKKMIKISSQFEMRPRGIFEYYGEDLVTYKLQKPTSESRHMFLTVIARYMTEYLEDCCPSRWIDCDHVFWNELLTTFYPSVMQITAEENNVDLFLYELKKFTHWLDKERSTNLYKIVYPILEEAEIDLKKCESLLNALYLQLYPHLHSKQADSLFANDMYFNMLENCEDDKYDVFEVQNVSRSHVVATSLETNYTYYMRGLPYKLLESGMIITGTICKMPRENLWRWNSPESVFPQAAKEYLRHVLIHEPPRLKQMIDVRD
ncbi:hypothetical protein EJF36_12525 [Bacillus sp. HMF5848]|uniref:hypothetical protein n=1 Tax=Bacillus sp. HMF5848 TaxID=2495421 RepID=UPI000F77EA46|nr:hypothetical protein [Bacillus sp. HMF5848]RSK27635.1 hypothetical protein EJF36_12525 [Bacillus sp. HMF5848]